MSHDPRHPACKDCIDLLVDYLEGALPPEKEKALDDHFMACPPCMDFVDQYRAASQLCRRAIAEDMPDALEVRLNEFLEKHLK